MTSLERIILESWGTWGNLKPAGTGTGSSPLVGIKLADKVLSEPSMNSEVSIFA